MKPSIVVFASGSGSNFQALIDACRDNRIPATIKGLIVTREDAGAVERAKNHGIPYRVLSKSDFNSNEDLADAINHHLDKWNPSLIILAGYLEKLPVEVIEQNSCPIINIHPSLLPKYGGKGYYGIKVHRAVIENGDKESGCTTHLVTPNYDEGQILNQAHVPVYENDTPETLAGRIRPHEHRILIETVNQLIHNST